MWQHAAWFSLIVGILAQAHLTRSLNNLPLDQVRVNLQVMAEQRQLAKHIAELWQSAMPRQHRQPWNIATSNQWPILPLINDIDLLEILLECCLANVQIQIQNKNKHKYKWVWFSQWDVVRVWMFYPAVLWIQICHCHIFPQTPSRALLNNTDTGKDLQNCVSEFFDEVNRMHKLNNCPQ